MTMKSPLHACFLLSVLLAGGCSCLGSAGIENAVAADQQSVSASETTCRTYGFRNWALQRDEQTTTISVEASMPTPAWSIVLHELPGADEGTIKLVMETIPPTGMSNSVITWILAEKTLDTSAMSAPDITVSCADEIVWSSQEP